MTITRRGLIQGVAGAGWISLAGGVAAQAPGTLKISHQFPSGTLQEGDFRDRLCRRFAADIEKRTGECFERGDGPNRGEKKRDEVGAEASRVAQHSRHVADLRAGVHPIMLPKAPQRFGKLRINTYGMELSLGA